MGNMSVFSILSVIFCLYMYSSGIVAQRLDKVIIDVDAGGDDAIAILLALQYEARLQNGFKVVAITCTYGNTYEHNVEQNVLKTLTMANRSDIPVYSGAQKPLLRTDDPGDFFGKDGFGDFTFDRKIIAKVNTSSHAAVALLDWAKHNPNQITLICLGPLTNIATAIALDPDFLSYFKRVYIMGSSVKGDGNQSPNVEFNFSKDPPANYMVLNSTMKNPVFLFPWETTRDSAITLDWRNKVFGQEDSELVRFINKVESAELSKISAWTPADAFTVAAVIWPELILKSILTHVEAVAFGQGRGSVLVDYANITDYKRNAIIGESFDRHAFQNKLLYYFK
ncbi:pyrimidine-specific ribonucleoside hydrolase RihA-like isoform X2 [Prorops nasuta]